MLINHHMTGEIRGKLIGINELKTHDVILETIWKEKIAHLPHPFVSEHQKVQHSHAPGAEKSHGHDPHVLAHIYGLAHADDREWVENVLTVLADMVTMGILLKSTSDNNYGIFSLSICTGTLSNIPDTGDKTGIRIRTASGI